MHWQDKVQMEKPLIRQLPIVALMVLTFILVQLSPPFYSVAYAHTTQQNIPAYACGDSNNNHCYGEMYWPGSMQGEKTDIRVVPINCGCDIFLNYEMWVQSSSGCSPNCWVEAGIKNETGYGYTFSFWADQRPGGGYHNHYMNGMLSGDYNHSTTFFIFKNGTNQWQVSKALAGVNGCSGSCSISWTNYSTSNTMQADYVTLGAELAGSSGASSPDVHFTYNSYYDGAHWHTQGNGNSGAGIRQDDPPYAYWVGGSPTARANGGDLDVYCC